MKHAKAHSLDPRNLIAEAYRIEGIGPEDCRSIFFDWALGLDPAEDPVEAARVLLEAHGRDPAHPMSILLRDAAKGTPQPRRRRRRGRNSKPG